MTYEFGSLIISLLTKLLSLKNTSLSCAANGVNLLTYFVFRAVTLVKGWKMTPFLKNIFEIDCGDQST
jgi:hypothetical protein